MAENLIGEMGSQLLSRIFGGIIWFGLFVMIIGILGGLVWYFFIYKRSFDIRVNIQSERANDRDSIIFYWAAIKFDKKTNSPYFQVWKLKRQFTVPKFNVLQRTNHGDYLEMYRKGEDEFYFLTPKRINKTKVIREDGKTYLLGDQQATMVDPGMAFWNTKRKNQNKKLLDTDNMLMKLLPFIPQIIGGMIMIFCLYILLDHMPQILSELTRLVTEMKAMQTAQVVTAG